MASRQLSKEEISERKQHLLSIGITEDNIKNIKSVLVPQDTANRVVSSLRKMVHDPVPFLNRHIWVMEMGSPFLERSLATFKDMMKRYDIKCNVKGFYECNVKLFTTSPQNLESLGEIAWEYGGKDGFTERLHFLISNSALALIECPKRPQGDTFNALASHIRQKNRERAMERIRRENPEISQKTLSMPEHMRNQRIAMERMAMTTNDPLTIKRLVTYGDKSLVQIIKDRGLYPRTEKEVV